MLPSPNIAMIFRNSAKAGKPLIFSSTEAPRLGARLLELDRLLGLCFGGADLDLCFGGADFRLGWRCASLSFLGSTLRPLGLVFSRQFCQQKFQTIYDFPQWG